MAATFCLRLAWGLIASTLLLPTAETPPRFFRVQFLIALGLLSAAGFFLFGHRDAWLVSALALGLIVCAAGSIIWHLDGSPLARWMQGLATVVLYAVMVLAKYEQPPTRSVGEAASTPTRSVSWWSLTDDVTSAALLGGCTSAMLMGHSYLIAPAMSLVPLMRLLAAMGAALVARVALTACAALQMSDGVGYDNETLLLLSLRWGLGFAGVLVLGWMSWESARIRSTQSATGILYVVVIFCFLGELSQQLLIAKTGVFGG